MKHFIPFLIIVIASTFSYANHCDHPLDEFAFERKIRELRSTRSGRYQIRMARTLVSDYCLTSLQVKSIVESFQDEELKLRFSQRAYRSVFDPENFYDVYDAFTSFSMAFRLHDIIHGIIPNPYLMEDEDRYSGGPRRISFPDLDYPKSTSYNGLIGCSNYVDNQKFASLSYSLYEKRSDRAKLEFMESVSKKHCLSMSQAMKLATMFDKDEMALKMLKAYLPKIYDMENFEAANAVFSSRYYKKEWMDYAEYVIAMHIPPTREVVCNPSPAELSQIKASMNKKHFPKQKLDLARLLVKDHCFTVAQIKGLMNAFTFSSYKLEFAKITYDSCLDPRNYYQLLDELTFLSEKKELRAFIDSRKNRLSS